MEGIGDTCKDKETIQKLSDGHPVILLRHAESMHNETSNGIKSREHTQEERLKDWIDKEHRDSPLNAVGIQQCEEASEVMNELNVGIVLISPMRRTLETAYYIFKNHPSFDMIKHFNCKNYNIKFIVVPSLKELLGSISSTPANVITLVEEFKTIFPNFDSTLLQEYEDPLHFFLEDISDDFAKRIILEKKIDEDELLGSNAIDLIIDYIKEVHPRKAESYHSLLQRVNKTK